MDVVCSDGGLMILKFHGLYGILLAVADEQIVACITIWTRRSALVDCGIFGRKIAWIMMLTGFWCCINKCLQIMCLEHLLYLVGFCINNC